MPACHRVIADLRTSIEKIERRSVLVERQRRNEGCETARGMPQVGAGTLSEVFATGVRDAGAGLGFCLMQAKGLQTPERPAVLWLQMRSEAQETGLPYGPGLSGFGFDPQMLAVIRTDTIAELLWAMEEAAGCPGVAAAIGDIARDHKALDFTALRRLSLRAERSGTALLVLRTGTGREASAARLRWHVAAEPSAAEAFEPRAPGAARYRVTLEKGGREFGGGAMRQDALGRNFWLLRWTEHGLAADTSDERDDARQTGKPALSGAELAGLGDRLPQTA
jgi:protein ImuA